jgi:hypothetical protein
MKLDRRFKKNKEYYRLVKRNRIMGLAVVWFFLVLAFLILIQTLTRPTLLSPKGSNWQPMNYVKPVKVEAEEQPFCRDVVACIRDVGESLEKDNQTIMKMIRISFCESGHRENAFNINTNKTLDRGVFQLNSIHKDISNKDAFDFEKNIRYAWGMQTKQGFTPWNSSKHCWNK